MTARLDASASVEDVTSRLEQDGHVVVTGMLDAPALATVRAELLELFASIPTGRNTFEGHKTQRVYALIAKTRLFDGLSTHPLILGVLDRALVHYQLSATQAVSIGAGEEAQTLHHDDAVYPLPRPHANVVMNTMWAIDDFTEANGGTRIVPGSHRWTDQSPDATTESVGVEMRAGSVLLYDGMLWHGGGHNRTDNPRLGVLLEYAASWLRQQENQILAVPRSLAIRLPERLQALLGYNVYPPFLGYVDGRHPRKLLGEGDG